MQQSLLFLIGPPRSGSTLLQRMLASHPRIVTHPEPHLLTPLAHLGYDRTVDKAPYDHINSAEALRLFVSHLPGGEGDYYEALRACTDLLYGRYLRAQAKTADGQGYFLDKTPAYALVLPFLQRLYPQAKVIVLTRHPLAVFSSYAGSFFGGDWRAAESFNPLLQRYVPAIGAWLRSPPMPLHHVVYERLVQQPEAEMRAALAYLDLPYDAACIDYGEHYRGEKGPGDPMQVNRHRRPVTDSLSSWGMELRSDASKLAMARRMIEQLAPEDLAAWGFPLATLWEPLQEAGGGQPARRPLNAYALQRRVLLALKKDIQHRPHGKLLRRMRYYCDVLLRD